MIKHAAAVAFLAVTATVSATGSFAQSGATQTAERFVAQCVKQVHARGSYVIQYGAAIPQVTAGSGATTRGASNVNDCLKDKYMTQPGLVIVSAPTTAPRNTGRVRDLNCNEILNRSPGAAAGYAFGSAILAGAVGASIQAGVYQRNLQACLSRHGGGAADLRTPVRFYSGGCKQGGLMVGGNRYCNN